MNPIKKIKSKASQFAINWAQFVIKFKWPVMILSLMLAFGIGSGGSKLGFDGDYHVFFSDDNPQLLAFDALQEKYTKDDNVFIVLTPKNGDVFTRENLVAIEELTNEAWNTPFSSRVDAVTNFQHTRAVEDDLYVDDLSYDSETKTDTEIDYIRNTALNEPLLVDRLVNSEGSVTAINVTVKIPGEDMMEVPNTTAFTREMVSNWQEKYPEWDVHLSGMVMMNTSFFEASQKDMSTLIPLMFLVIIITVFLLTRNIGSTIVTLFVIILSIVTAAGMAGFLGIKLTPPSASFPTIILTLAVADSIHILITFLYNMRVRHLSKNEALIDSIRVNYMPVFITSLTTVIGFLSMNFGDVPPFRDLGNITAIGMSAAFLYSVTFLPAFLAIIPVKVKLKEEDADSKGTYLTRLGTWVSERPKVLAPISLVIIIGISLLGLKNEFNDEFVNYFDESVKFRTDTDYISANLTGIYNVEFSIPAEQSGGINDPGYLAKINEFENWLNDQPEVIHVNTFAEVARRINKSMHGDQPEYYKVPESREEAAQYLLLYEMSLPFGLDLNNQINVDKSETRLTITVQNLASRELIEFTTRTENWLTANTPDYMHAKGTGPTLMFSHMGFRQAESMSKGNIVALVLISLVLIIALRNLKLGLLSIIPNVVPVFVGFGIWAIFKGQINTGMIVVFGMTLGIIVDDTVHFMSKFLRARREHGYNAKEAVVYAFNTVGQALVTTTIVLVAGFAILAQSSFALNSNMAAITSIIITAALIIDFVLLPSLLILLSKDSKA